MRSHQKILDVGRELTDKLWYEKRFKPMQKQIAEGTRWLVDGDMTSQPWNVTSREVWESMLSNARRIEEAHGTENLGPYTDDDWGMLLGKLSAIRWVLGLDWDDFSI